MYYRVPSHKIIRMRVITLTHERAGIRMSICVNISTRMHGVISVRILIYIRMTMLTRTHIHTTMSLRKRMVIRIGLRIRIHIFLEIARIVVDNLNIMCYIIDT